MTDRPEALLIYPPVHDFALYDLYLKPYGLLNIAAMLEAGGWNTRLINALDYTDESTVEVEGSVRRKADGTGKFHRQTLKLPPELQGIRRKFARYGILKDVLKQKIAEEKPDAIFISSGMTYWYRGVVEAAELCRELWPDVPLIIGGVYASLMPEHCVRVCKPDYIAAGNMTLSGSTVLSESGRALNAFLEAGALPGAVPSSDAPLDHDCWNDAAVLRLNDGCPMNCGYCASRSLCGGFSPGRPEKVFKRLRLLAETRGTRNFAFYDDAVLFDSSSVFIPFLKQVVDYSSRTGTRFNFYTPNAMHIRYMTAEIADLMKSAGFQEVRLGFESASDEFHSEYDNKYSERGFHNTVRMLTDAGFDRSQIVVYILAGLPGQRASEVEDTIRFAADRGFTLSVSEFSPVPGSPMWPDCVARCSLPLEDEPLYHNNSFFPMEWEGFTRADMQRLKALSKQRL
ncbi:MAG: radical SAM protein [Spirochaetales bacterium]|uniref:Radical SAM protein n=1 Tax=Candidatus Thalassospirochaeta sargassi TaxID=3119039 RepID=A0AAJ1I9Y2_9SPIO|nr:radical SAM protein [Spirochaetales bacterium]